MTKDAKQNITAEEAQNALKKESENRKNNFIKEMNELMKKYNCELVPYVIISAKGNDARIEVLAK